MPVIEKIVEDHEKSDIDTYIHIGTYTVHTYIYAYKLISAFGGENFDKFINNHQSINPFSSTEIALHGIMQYTTWLVLSNIPRG